MIWRSLTMLPCLSLQPWSLARLKEDINPLFRAGKIVALSNELYAEYRTPTKVGYDALRRMLTSF